MPRNINWTYYFSIFFLLRKDTLPAILPQGTRPALANHLLIFRAINRRNRFIIDHDILLPDFRQKLVLPHPFTRQDLAVHSQKQFSLEWETGTRRYIFSSFSIFKQIKIRQYRISAISIYKGAELDNHPVANQIF